MADEQEPVVSEVPSEPVAEPPSAPVAGDVDAPEGGTEGAAEEPELDATALRAELERERAEKESARKEAEQARHERDAVNRQRDLAAQQMRAEAVYAANQEDARRMEALYQAPEVTMGDGRVISGKEAWAEERRRREYEANRDQILRDEVFRQSGDVILRDAWMRPEFADLTQEEKTKAHMDAWTKAMAEGRQPPVTEVIGQMAQALVAKERSKVDDLRNDIKEMKATIKAMQGDGVAEAVSSESGPSAPATGASRNFTLTQYAKMNDSDRAKYADEAQRMISEAMKG